MPSFDKIRAVFLSHGERFGFVLVIILGISFFFFQKTPAVFSETLNNEEGKIESSSNSLKSFPPEQEKVVESVAIINKETNSTLISSPTTQPEVDQSVVARITLSPSPTVGPSPTVTITASSTPTVVQVTLTTTPAVVPVDPNNDEIWEKIAECESHKNWSIDTGNTYFGGLQFSQGAWESVGGSGNPAAASREEQIMRGKMLQQVRGWGVWGACSKQLGLN